MSLLNDYAWSYQQHRQIERKLATQLKVLTPRHAVVLSLTKQPTTLSELSEIAGATRPHMTSIVDKLLAKGLVTRAQGGDRRTLVVEITDKGKELIKMVS